MENRNHAQKLNQRQLPLVEVRGTHLEIGSQMGEALRPQIQHSIANAHILLDSAYEQLQLTWDNAQVQARKYIPFAEERYPQYVEELKGMAAGANISYDDIFVLNAMEAVTTDALHLTKCTSMAVNQECTADHHVLMAHNEDWVPEDESDVFIINAVPEDEPPFLAMSYGGLLPNIGMNAYGIAQCCDTVYPNDVRIGIPRLVVSRAVFAAHTPADAIRSMLVPHRAAGYNHLLAHESGEIYNVEVSARKFALIYGENGYLAHTNHFIDDQMHLVEKDTEELISTRVRYLRALRLLKKSHYHTLASLQTIQCDHMNFEASICNHSVEDSNPLDREKTIVGLVMDLTERRIHACWGNPCENEFFTYTLRG